MDLMEIRRRLLMGVKDMKSILITIQNACTTGTALMNEIRAVIPTDDFIAVNTIPADTLKLTNNSVAGINYLNYGTNGVRPDNYVMVWNANYWHTQNTSNAIDVPAGSVFKAFIVDYK